MTKLLLTITQLYSISTKVLAQNTDKRYMPPAFNPASSKLFNTIAKLDSIYFDAYNTSKPKLIDSLTSENLEFYHDRGGLTTSKPDYLLSLQKYIYGKVTRRLTPGSLEVYDIPGFGAIEFGYHSFSNKAERGESQPSKFVIFWQQKGDKWRLTRVVSLH